ncbi:MAG: DUF6069 family protein [Microbacteriaceae bacterium]|jgi:hypothetical protein
MTNAYRAAGPPPAVDAGRLWVGGLATALVAALTAAVGVLIATGLLDVDVLAPPGFTGSVIGDYAIAAAIAALLATALIHLLLVASPRPLAFFHWIIGLLIIVVTLLPFASAAELPTKLATAAINLVVGIAIASLTSGTAARVARTSRGTAGGDPALG